MRIFSIILVGAVMTYLIVLGGIYGSQRAILYHPNTQYLTPRAMTNLPPGIEEIKLRTSDGETIISWYLPAKPGNRTILFFTGNAGHLPFTADRFRNVDRLGMGMMAVAYRGFSGSTGTPTEAGLYKDADAAYAWLAAKVPADQIILHGAALGAAVATELAVKSPARELVLEAPYTAAVDVFAKRFWFLPIPYIALDKFLTRDIIGKVKMPVLFIRGDSDTVVSLAMSQSLFERAVEPKTFRIITGGSHNNLSELGLYEAMRDFAEAQK